MSSRAFATLSVSSLFALPFVENESRATFGSAIPKVFAVLFERRAFSAMSSEVGAIFIAVSYTHLTLPTTPYV